MMKLKQSFPNAKRRTAALAEGILDELNIFALKEAKTSKDKERVKRFFKKITGLAG